MKKYTLTLFALATAGLCFAQSVKESDFGKTKDGELVKEYTLKNNKGTEAKIITYGAIIRELWVADRNGKKDDVVLGFDNMQSYETISPYFGAVVGRYGNRIGDGKFSIDGTEYNLPKNNNGVACLHGGNVGFDKKVWKAQTKVSDNAVSVILSVVSPDGDQGFPGNLKATVTYTLNNNNELIMNYKATTNKPTVCNLTNHSYFNLAGAGKGTILNHELTINADKFTVVDKNLIPTGELRDVTDTPFDFRQPKAIGSRIEFDYKQLKLGKGYDHNFVLNKTAEKAMDFAIRLYEPISGREMLVYTQEPGVQFYCGNVLQGEKGKDGKIYHYRYGLALETQHFPDSPNQKSFPSTTLRPNEVYDTTTIFKFQVQ